jgi:hypothetical protein
MVNTCEVPQALRIQAKQSEVLHSCHYLQVSIQGEDGGMANVAINCCAKLRS